jgi:hypothetical protein
MPQGWEPGAAFGGAQPCGPLRPSWSLMVLMVNTDQLKRVERQNPSSTHALLSWVAPSRAIHFPSGDGTPHVRTDPRLLHRIVTLPSNET